MDAHPTGGVLSFLKNLPDPRGHNTRHSLMAVVTIALLAVMSHIQCDGKGQEIDAIRQLLALVDSTGAVATIDALGCQTPIAEEVNAGLYDFAMGSDMEWAAMDDCAYDNG